MASTIHEQAEAERIAYVAAEREARLEECEERAARLKTRAYAAEWSEPGPDPLSPDKRAALNAAMALATGLSARALSSLPLGWRQA